MAWIESHQELRTNPKVGRLADMLDVSVADALGRLHMLWWWALDHADDGDLSDFTAGDIARACDWLGDSEMFVKALVDCGPGSKAGFVEDAEGRWVLHHWWEYAGKLVARREADRQRKRAERDSGAVRKTPVEVQRTSEERPLDIRTDGVRTVPNPTKPPRADVDALCDLLADLIEENGSPRPRVSNKWRDEARLLLDRDHVSLAEAQRVLRWCQHDRFWKTNVLSMPKFREKFMQLRLKANASAPTGTDEPRGFH